MSEDKNKLDPFKKPLVPNKKTKSLVVSATPGGSAKVAAKRPSKILDEDEYVEKVGNIIERDFFPELEKFRAQADYLDAMKRNDKVAMRRLRERFSSTESITNSDRFRGRLKSPDTFETPEEPLRQDDDLRTLPASDAPRAVTPSSSKAESVIAESEGGKSDPKHVSLDRFMAAHTSEDNASFNEIQEEQFRKFRVDKSWMFKNDEQKSIENKVEELALPDIETQALEGTDVKSLEVGNWTYKNVNTVFYKPDGAAFTKDEAAERAKKVRVINFENTRFSKNPWKTDLQKKNINSTSRQGAEREAGKVGPDGVEFKRPDTPSVNGFKLLKALPSPSPGAAGESPFMTWGEVESTPYRLEGAETPIPLLGTGAIAGGGFSIQNVPKRDRLALELADKNIKFHRDKKNKAIAGMRSNIKTPKSGLTQRVANMSPAAQRLASGKLGIRLGTDKALRASYTPSPARSSSSKTPGGSTVGRHHRPGSTSALIRPRTGGDTPSKSVRKITTPKTPSSHAGSLITDNLLDLASPSSGSSSSASTTPRSSSTSSSSKSRMKASDFL